MADISVALEWTGEGLQFDGGPVGGPDIRIDGDCDTGPAPMQTMLLGVVGCTAVDVVLIMKKMRVPLEGLSVRVEADRAQEVPRRYTRIHMVYAARGVGPEHEDKLRRAVDLSHEKYCSALHSLRPDIELSADVVLG